jgi:hypothetical protein
VFFGHFEAKCQTRVRILYTTTIETRNEYDLLGFPEKLLITKANDLLGVAFNQNTQINIAFDIAGYYKWNFDQYQVGWGQLSPCQIKENFLKSSSEVNTRANETAADLVTSLIHGDDVNGVMGCADLPGMYSAADWRQIWYGYDGRTFQHEIGHNFNCGENSGYCDLVNQFHTLMIYHSICGTPSIAYFCADPSSGVLYNGLPIGDATHNNRQVIINRMPTTAAQRSPVSTVNLTNRILTKGECLDVMATNQITTGASVSATDSGAILSLRCTGPVTIGDGLTIQNVAGLSVNSGSTALLPKKREEAQKHEQQNPSNIVPVQKNNRIYIHQNCLKIELLLTESAPVSYLIYGYCRNFT